MPAAVPSTTRAWAVSVRGVLAGGGAGGTALCHMSCPLAVPLRELRSLSLQRCPHVDDWCLNRLHPLAASLEELSLAGCPRVSERGLACLHHLQ